MKNNIGKEWEKFFDQNEELFKVKTSPALDKLKKSELCEKIKKVLCKMDRDGDRILEIGCGSGKLGVAISTEGFDTTMSDYSMKMVKETRKVSLKISNGKRVKILRENMNKLSYCDNTFDFSFNIGSIEHFLATEERINIIKEMLRVTKKKGKILIVVPNGKHPFYKIWEALIHASIPAETRYDPKRLKEELTKAGCNNITIEPIGVNEDFDQYLKHKILKPLVLIANKFVYFLPMRLRMVFTVHFFCVGEK